MSSQDVSKTSQTVKGGKCYKENKTFSDDDLSGKAFKND